MSTVFLSNREKCVIIDKGIKLYQATDKIYHSELWLIITILTPAGATRCMSAASCDLHILQDGPNEIF